MVSHGDGPSCGTAVEIPPHRDPRKERLNPQARMIIADAVIPNIPPTVLTIGSNTNDHPETFVSGYNVIEKIQMLGFFLREVVLSVYILETIRILRTLLQQITKRFM